MLEQVLTLYEKKKTLAPTGIRRPDWSAGVILCIGLYYHVRSFGYLTRGLTLT